MVSIGEVRTLKRMVGLVHYIAVFALSVRMMLSFPEVCGDFRVLQKGSLGGGREDDALRGFDARGRRRDAYLLLGSSEPLHAEVSGSKSRFSHSKSTSVE